MVRTGWLAILLIGLCVGGLAFAEPPDNRPPEKKNGPNNATAISGSTARAVSESVSGANSLAKGGSATVGDITGGDVNVGPTNVTQEGSTATVEGVAGGSVGDVSLTGGTTRIERQVPDGYFNYSNNYVACMRTIGFQYGNQSGIGSVGIPLRRDKSCDVWFAVNEAQENGHVLLSYAFMCEIRNIKEVWGKERCNKLVGLADDWFESTLGVQDLGK